MKINFSIRETKLCHHTFIWILFYD